MAKLGARSYSQYFLGSANLVVAHPHSIFQPDDMTALNGHCPFSSSFNDLRCYVSYVHSEFLVFWVFKTLDSG